MQQQEEEGGGGEGEEEEEKEEEEERGEEEEEQEGEPKEPAVHKSGPHEIYQQEEAVRAQWWSHGFGGRSVDSGVLDLVSLGDPG